MVNSMTLGKGSLREHATRANFIFTAAHFAGFYLFVRFSPNIEAPGKVAIIGNLCAIVKAYQFKSPMNGIRRIWLRNARIDPTLLSSLE